jgi:hypothetical protein
MRSGDSIHNVEIAAEEISERVFLLEYFKTEGIRILRREFSKRLAKSPPRFVVEVALRLLDKHTMEHRFVAQELVYHHRAAHASLTEKDMEGWKQTLNRVENPALQRRRQSWLEIRKAGRRFPAPSAVR